MKSILDLPDSMQIGQSVQKIKCSGCEKEFAYGEEPFSRIASLRLILSLPVFQETTNKRAGENIVKEIVFRGLCIDCLEKLMGLKPTKMKYSQQEAEELILSVIKNIFKEIKNGSIKKP